MIAPTVHLNGTSADELLRQVREAEAAIAVALRALHETMPNGRDYYTQGPAALLQARDEFRSRVDRLVDVREDLLQLVEAIDAQRPRCSQCGPGHVKPGTDVCERHGKRVG